LRDAAQDLSLYGSFLENHDIERFPSFTQDKVSPLCICVLVHANRVLSGQALVKNVSAFATREFAF
jgi:hypothetical protein